jgi:hypothetical protein
VADYFVQEEDGTSKITLEEGGGSLLLEDTNVARVSQDVVEVILRTAPSARASQDVVEVILRTVPAARASQDVVEVMMQNTVEDSTVWIIDWQIKDA